jgi:hypothetical protein
MLEDGVQADNGKIRVAQHAVDLLGLWNRVSHAARTKHLEGMQQYGTTTQGSKRQRFFRIEPTRDLELRCENVF